MARERLAVATVACATAFATLGAFVWWSPGETSFESRIADVITSSEKDLVFRVFDAAGIVGSRGAVAATAVLLAACAFW